MARALPRDGTIAASCKAESRDSALHVFAVINRTITWSPGFTGFSPSGRSCQHEVSSLQCGRRSAEIRPRSQSSLGSAASHRPSAPASIFMPLTHDGQGSGGRRKSLSISSCGVRITAPALIPLLADEFCKASSSALERH